jgi:hypothetical protein
MLDEEPKEKPACQSDFPKRKIEISLKPLNEFEDH